MMKTVILDEPGHYSLIDRDKPTPKAGEALVKVHRVGICGTDLHAFSGNQPFFEYPRVLGHELGVEVIEVNGDNPKGLQPGDKCSVEPYMFNPDSYASQAGLTNACESMQVLGVHSDGGMSEYICVPANKLHKSDKLNFDQLALVETLCIGAHAVERANPRVGENVLVIGAGPIDLGAMQFAQAEGARVIAMDINDERLSFCRETLGISASVNALANDLEDQLRHICDGNLPTVIIDATGNKRSMENTFKLAGHGCRIVFLGLFIGEVQFDDPSFHRKELTLMASRNALPETFTKVIKAIEEGRLDTSSWVTQRMQLGDVPEVFASVPGQAGQIKAVIEVSN
ncbi:zinc-binding alcohol dehydrogenase family protein [Persicirhabdus sediminis]|uniref:Zinc-binding alcohol dehydrogenase family protein n=1 Tax=Persicirhabdus sediminis TaxID=454144 RepID=A0A8J7SL19_9BACT|nr:zinc-binding alcohol dehydrogenase family protein [Persicirhabdus sediminis]MBK1792494.1 zinc-binding alcohol dehydrogenase family protein [Persicirhabdus sediminis]